MRRNYVSEGFDMPVPEEEAQAWAERVGYRDGYNGGVSEEGKAALAGEWYERRPYIRQYQEGFLERKLDAGGISEDEYFFYDPHPGRWGRYCERVVA